jgi:heme/copper-type cytochrome/quinol oxidase subunit 3
MAREAVARRVIEPEVADELRTPAFGGGEEPPSGVASPAPIIGNARLALLMFIAAETMFFAGLIGAFLVFRLASPAWPPPFQPRLAVGVTAINTVILLLSGLTMRLALMAGRRGKSRRLAQWLSITALLGTVFLGIQGYEWLRLIGFGLTLSSGVYGATFYTLIGCHGLHVFGALLWLVVVLLRARKGRYSERNYAGVQLCAMYWTFVVGLWPVLYGLVYLS